MWGPGVQAPGWELSCDLLLRGYKPRGGGVKVWYGSVGWVEVLGMVQSKRKTSNANGQTNLGHKHKAPDHNHEATQPMVDLPHTS